MSKSADAFRTISEVADWLGVQTHVLRFWESKFTQIKPVKRAGGRRYYRPADMLLLGGIRKLLHEDGLTIKGVQKLLREEGMAHVCDMSAPLDDETAAQIDGDLIPEAGFVEAEPASASEPSTVTPFAPPTPASKDPASNAAAEAPAETPAPISAQAPQDADPEPGETRDEPAPPASEPVAATPSDPEPPVAAAPSDSAPPASTDEASKAQAPGNAAPGYAAPSPQTSATTSIDADAPGPTGAPAPADPTDSAEDDSAPIPAASSPQTTDPAKDDTAPVDLPSFLTARPQNVASGTAAKTDTAQPDDPVPAQVRPRPRIIDVPDEVAPESLDVAPSALSKTSRIKHLTPAQRHAILPILAQLTALRDHMANARHDPR